MAEVECSTRVGFRLPFRPCFEEKPRMVGRMLWEPITHDGCNEAGGSAAFVSEDWTTDRAPGSVVAARRRLLVPKSVGRRSLQPRASIQESPGHPAHRCSRPHSPLLPPFVALNSAIWSI